MPRKSLLLGTAGHVDHGKTSLVRALTGSDTDRLPEEKARGITIELGFAHLALPDGIVLGVVDVPGHERFVRHMLMGASGMDLVLLVVAADEGVMPQTREHLDICGLLGARAGVVALTKIDRVDGDLAALAAEEVRQGLAGSALAGAPIVPVSSVTGAGLPELRAAIAEVARGLEGRSDTGSLRLPVDRVFTLKGLGTVVTGTLASGRLSAGEALVAIPGGAAATARSLQVHGGARDEAAAGERVAANLAGTPREALGRGDVLVRPGEVLGSTVVDVELAWLAVAGRPLRRPEKVLCHALATQESAVVVPLGPPGVEPGARGLAQLHLGRPVALVPGDRFVLRGFRVLPGHGTTLGGGRVLRVAAPKRRRADAGAVTWLLALAAASPERRAALEIEAAGAAGLDAGGLGARLGLRRDQAVALAQAATRGRSPRPGAADVVALGDGVFVARAILDELAAAAERRLRAFHAANPQAPGESRESLKVGLGRRPEGLGDRVFAALLERLTAAERCRVEGEHVRLGSFRPRSADGVDPDVKKLRGLFGAAGLAPPWLDEVGRVSGLREPAVRAALDILLRRGELVRVRSDLYFARAAVDELAGRLQAFLAERGQITAQEWKALTGQSRKYAIPLAEHFDATKLTLRVGEIRRLRGK
jgi:selenocysteine-specific elongation factor